MVAEENGIGSLCLCKLRAFSWELFRQNLLHSYFAEHFNFFFVAEKDK